jgi:predicted transcriptional regulator
VRQPKYQKRSGGEQNWTFDTQVELPYTVEEIAEAVNRKQGSVLRSLRHLEKRGKVKDVHGGWRHT